MDSGFRRNDILRFARRALLRLGAERSAAEPRADHDQEHCECEAEPYDPACELATEHGKTVVLATHDLNEASEIADQIGILHRGRLVKTVINRTASPGEGLGGTYDRSTNRESLENLFSELCREKGDRSP